MNISRGVMLAATCCLLATSAYPTAAQQSKVPAPRFSKPSAGAPPPASGPTAPSGLSATAVSASEIDLKWDAALPATGNSIVKYFIERCQGSPCANFSAFATSPTAGYKDMGLTAGTTYAYRVSATDSANNTSAYSGASSATASAAPGGTVTAPADLKAINISATEIDLSWTASTGVAGSPIAQYSIERCTGAGCATFGPLGVSAGTSYADKSLAAGPSYTYRVRATDNAGNTSVYSGTSSAVAAPPAVAPSAGPPTAPANLLATRASDNSKEVDITWTASTPATGNTISQYSIERCTDSACTKFTAIGSSTGTSYTDTTVDANSSYSYRVSASDNAGLKSSYSLTGVPPGSANSLPCALFPLRSGCLNYGQGSNANINTFFNTDGSLSYFNQLKSIYNQASGAATVSANLATLNFPKGFQVDFVTNVQAGSSGSAIASTAATPTLSANGAAQATQNMLYGGTVYAALLYPLLAFGASRPNKPGNLGMVFDLVGREGVDVQNFKSGANVSATSPPSHTTAALEGYVQYNSINLIPGTTDFAGAIFFGGSYGYSYTSHGYARDYGFGDRVNNDLGQISFGILINNVATVSFSRAFGPPQTYIDSTSMLQTKVNNFKSWSFGITYQSNPNASK